MNSLIWLLSIVSFLDGTNKRVFNPNIGVKTIRPLFASGSYAKVPWDKNGRFGPDTECRTRGGRECCQYAWRIWNIFLGHKIFDARMQLLADFVLLGIATHDEVAELHEAKFDEEVYVRKIEADDAVLGPLHSKQKDYFTVVCYDTRSDTELIELREPRKSRKLHFACAVGEYADFKEEDSLRLPAVTFLGHTAHRVQSALCKTYDKGQEPKRTRTTNIGINTRTKYKSFMVTTSTQLISENPKRQCLRVDLTKAIKGDTILTGVQEVSRESDLNHILPMYGQPAEELLEFGRAHGTASQDEDMSEFAELLEASIEEAPRAINFLDLVVDTGFAPANFANEQTTHLLSQSTVQSWKIKIDPIVSQSVTIDSPPQAREQLRAKACVVPMFSSPDPSIAMDSLVLRTIVLSDQRR